MGGFSKDMKVYDCLCLISLEILCLIFEDQVQSSQSFLILNVAAGDELIIHFLELWCFLRVHPETCHYIIIILL